MKLDSYDLKVMDEVEDFLLTDFEIKKYPEKNEGYIENDKLISMIENLLYVAKEENK